MMRLGLNLRNSYALPGIAIAEILIIGIVLTLLTVVVVPRLSHASNTEREQQLRDTLHQFRTQIMAYRAEHGGLAPGFPGGNPLAMPTYGAFVDQMTQYTNHLGETSQEPSDAYPFGPYLERIPENPLRNNGSDIRLVERGQLMVVSADDDHAWIYQPATGTLVANLVGSDSRGILYSDY